MGPHGDFVEIAGPAREVGRRFGRLAARALAKRIATVRRSQARAGVTDAVLASRVREFASHLERIAPHWLDEAAGTAEGASVATEDVLLLNCLPAPLRTPGDECTSFVRVAADRCAVFKIRDYRPCAQVFIVKAIDGQVRLQTGMDVGNLGAAHCLSARAVAGACNTGSPSLRVADGPKLNDCHMLRWLCERAGSAAEVPRLAEELVASGTVGGAGGDRGSILLVGAPDGGGVLEIVPEDIEVTEVPEGTFVASNHFLGERARSWASRPPDENTLRRKARMEELLGALPARSDGPAPPEAFAISRDREGAPDALCNDDSVHPSMTVSAALHVLDRRVPSQSYTHICCGNTRNSFFLPVPLAEKRSFRPLAGGGFYALADAVYRAWGTSAHLADEQRRIEREGISFERAARDAYAALASLAGRDADAVPSED